MYVGTTGTGKTHAALADLRAQPLPRVFLDLGCSKLLESVPQAAPASRKALPAESRWVPETVEELEAVLENLYKRGNVAILIDDCAALRSPRMLAKACRLWRPRNLRIALTTQHISGDIDQAVMACDPLIFAYRCTSPTSIDWLWDRFRITPEENAALPLGESFELSF